MENTVLYVVIPCYNEEAVLPETAKQLSGLFQTMTEEKRISPESKILFVNDGSRDKTWDIICQLKEQNSMFQGIKLAKNAGHQNALLAGLMTAKEYCDCAISIDADLQDDIFAIPKFIEKFDQGNQIVYGVRSKRETDTFFKKHTALLFYRLMKIMGVNIIYNHADYRLMSKRALDELSNFKETNLFLRGLVPLLGFESCEVYYERNERFAGESKYPFKKMLSFAMDGITSFSITPIRMISTVGGIFALMGVIYAIYGIVTKIMGNTTDGWASIIVSIWIIGGVQLLALGLIGEYIGKIYKEVKQRPKYIIEKYIK